MPRIIYKDKLRFGPVAAALLERAIEIMEEYDQQGYEMTLRQLYYQLVSRDMLANEQKEYDRLGDIIARGRLAGFVDWEHIVDRTRNVDAPRVRHSTVPLCLLLVRDACCLDGARWQSVRGIISYNTIYHNRL